MSAISVTVLDAKGQVGIEGFDDPEQAASWLLEHLTRRGSYYGRHWTHVNFDHHGDMREVIAMLDTAGHLARFLVRLGYQDSEVIDAVRNRFPEANAGAEVHLARGEKHADDHALEAELDADARDQEFRS